jgi:hypothetical protein
VHSFAEGVAVARGLWHRFSVAVVTLGVPGQPYLRTAARVKPSLRRLSMKSALL